MRTLRKRILAGVLGILVGVLVGCGGQPRYSDDPEAARIQGLTDFCIGYATLRDAATNFIKIDIVRTDPVLSVDAVVGYQTSREFIKPFCSVDFDPTVSPFDLSTLEDQLVAIRIILLKKENQQ